MRRKIFLGMMVLALNMYSYAQVSIQLIVNPTPPAKLSEWALRGSTVTLVATNISPVPKTVIIYSEIKTISGDLVATKMPVPGLFYTLPTGNTLFSVRDVIPLNYMSFAGSYRSGLQKTGKLPQGVYQLSVRLDSISGAPVTTTATSIFTLAGIQLPILFAPYDKEHLSATIAQTAITFQWTNVIKSSPEVAYYNLQVFEVLPRQKNVQAMRANQPILNVIIRGATQYIWRPQLLFTDSLQHKFIWTIRTTDASGNLFSTTDANAEGRSEPKIFIIGSGHLKQ